MTALATLYAPAERATPDRDGAEAALDLKVWANPMQACGEHFTFMAIGDISEEKRRLFLERIFLNRSFSTKGGNRGLGTYSMKVLTERYLGGDVSFASSEESGTTFTVRCPLAFRGKGAAG